MKPLLWFTLLFAVVLAGDRAGGFLTQSAAASSQFRYSRLYNGTAQAQILLVGNSRGLAFYQPYIEEITRKSTFNLSYNGMPAPLAKVLVADYLERYSAPEKILIDITLCDRPNRELIAGFTTYAGESSRLDTLIKGANSDIWWGGKVSALFRYNNEVFQRALFYKNRSDEDWLINRQIAPALAATVPLDTFPVSIQPGLIRDVAEMVAIAQKSGAEVHLVIGPYYPGMVRNWDNLQAVRRAVEAATGQKVSDYSQSLSDPADFGDLMHPNKKGAQHFMDLLKKDGIL